MCDCRARWDPLNWSSCSAHPSSGGIWHSSFVGHRRTHISVKKCILVVSTIFSPPSSRIFSTLVPTTAVLSVKPMTNQCQTHSSKMDRCLKVFQSPMCSVECCMLCHHQHRYHAVLMAASWVPRSLAPQASPPRARPTVATSTSPRHHQ